MSDDITLQQLLEVQAHFGLPSPALVEKDFHVVKALAAIAAVQTPPLQLVFGGGTALSRAHRLIGRMSEHIDLKIIADEEPLRGALRRLRDAMTDALLRAGFRFDPGDPAHRKSANESRYTIYRLPYEPLSRGEGALRPEIQIEAAVWPLRRPALTLPVSSFVAEALKRPSEVARILARAIMPHDAEIFGNQFPAYRADPMGETRRAVHALASDPRYARRYAEFQRDMVYGDALAYADALVTISALAENLDED